LLKLCLPSETLPGRKPFSSNKKSNLNGCFFY
jgi:hypothetical protein